ncbi:hypothetical protein EYV94_25900 [Puteibacter caeruleilacunae]|nr:hypothetical protein EYV94_25900 [Puteibacter caeruleilacunae]
MKEKNKDLIKFITVMAVFMAGMIVMIVHHIHSWWIWLVYISIWTYAEAIIARNFHLKWWAWVVIIGGISILDLIIISTLNNWN